MAVVTGFQYSFWRKVLFLAQEYSNRSALPKGYEPPEAQHGIRDRWLSLEMLRR